MKTKSLVIIILISLALISCGTIQPSIPPTPLKKGDGEIRIGFSMPTNNFSVISLQANILWGFTDRDIIGLGFNSFFIPYHISYAHYWTGDYVYGGNFQIHLNNNVWDEYNPDLEFDLALSNYYSNFSQSLKLGLGLYAYRNIFNLFSSKYVSLKLLPIFGYLARIYNIQLEGQLFLGVAKHLISNYHDYAKSLDSVSKIILFYKNIDNIQIDSIGKFDLIIKLKDSTDILITQSIPGPGFSNSWYLFKELSWLLPDSNYHVYWIYNREKNKYFTSNCMVLNLNKILNDYKMGKDLIIKEDDDIVEQKQKQVKFWNNLDIGIGYRYIEKGMIR